MRHGVCGFTPSTLPGISPTRGEISKMLPLAPSAASREYGTRRQVDLPPCGGDVRQDRGG
ncbi:conserved hypothetical protein [Agrobacterium genomosp. 13 str. CFBP 6927]|uniref:Uncharacterized protein n=1 Tax=Agrobacterium genomosp. 13 str. CFBP 6927 TaxID=1183428 RepID=A0ABM9VK93_9HYPH|nr:conserved hypothetical protein [Agrobacterium genomosp. 13 str. CFBP 6927]